MDMIDKTLVAHEHGSKVDYMVTQLAFENFQKNTNEQTLQNLKNVIEACASNRKKRLETIKQLVNSIPG
jgi:hypothetical protein